MTPHVRSIRRPTLVRHRRLRWLTHRQAQIGGAPAKCLRDLGKGLRRRSAEAVRCPAFVDVAPHECELRLWIVLGKLLFSSFIAFSRCLHDCITHIPLQEAII